MPLEIASTIADLVITNPVGASDTPAALDDHIQLIKKVLKADALVNADIGVNVAAYSHNHTGTYQPVDAELTALAGLTSAANKVPMFSGSGTATLVDFKDEDDMASNSATAVPSQQSVKAYVDNSNSATFGTAVNSTSGTYIDFTGIPSGINSISVMLSDVSTNGTSNWVVQVGDSGGIESTGYLSYANTFDGTPGGTNSTAGFLIVENITSAANTFSGIVQLNRVSANSWVSAANVSSGNSLIGGYGSGSKTLSGELDRVRLTTVNGTDTFDAGVVNIYYQ